MIPLRLILLGVTIIGTIGFAVYSNYQNRQQQSYQHSYGEVPPRNPPRLSVPSSKRKRKQCIPSENDFIPAWNTSSNTSVDGTSKSPKEEINESKQINPSCSICLTDTDKAFTQLCCGHNFHMKCIMPWLTQGQISCPNCRAKVV